MDLDNIPETAPAPTEEATPAEAVTTIEVTQPAADDNRSFMETLVEEAGSQMETGAPKPPEKKDEPAGDKKPTEEAPPQTPEKKTDVPKVDDDTPPKGFSKEAGRVFRELKAEVRAERDKAATFEQERATLTARVQELEKSVGEVEKLREAIKERDARLTDQQQAIELIRVESSDLWKNEVAKPMQDVVSASATLAKEYEIPEADLLSAITSNNKRKLDELLSDIPEYDRFEAHTLRKKYADIIAHRESLQQSGSERLAKLRQEEADRENSEMEQQRKERTQIIEKTLPAVERNISRFLETPEDKERMSKALEIAKADALQTYPAHVQAGAVMAVAALPILSRQIDALKAQLAQRDADLAGYRKSDPGAGGGGQRKAQENQNVFDENDNFEVALVKSVHAGHASR